MQLCLKETQTTSALEKEKKKDIVVGINTFHWLSRVQILPLSPILASDLAFLNFRGLFT